MSESNNNVVTGAQEVRTDHSQGSAVRNVIASSADKAGEVTLAKIDFDSAGTGPQTSILEKAYHKTGLDTTTSSGVITLCTLPVASDQCVYLVLVDGVYIPTAGYSATAGVAFSAKIKVSSSGSALSTENLIEAGNAVNNFATGAAGADAVVGLSTNDLIVTIGASADRAASAVCTYTVKIICSKYPTSA